MAPAKKPASKTATRRPSKASEERAAAAPPRQPRPRKAAAPAAPAAPEVPVEAARVPADDAAPPEVVRTPSVRLHKFLAHAGVGSRREAEGFIEQGRVSVNGKPITTMGFKVDPAADRVTLDGEAVKTEEPVYYMLHKPGGFICTNHDERGRPRAVDLLRGVKQRVYTVGRLDADSLGLILVTNDGDLANVICHPRYRLEKRYQVAVKGFVTREQIAKLEAGVWLAEGKSSPAKVQPLGRNQRRNETILEMTVFEGRNREIRRVFARVGLDVRRLLRISIGPLELADLQPGEARPLTRADLKFVDDARRMYEANKAAWDAELPQPEPKKWTPRPPRKQGGGRPGWRGPRAPRGPGEGGRFGGPRLGGGGGGFRGRDDGPRPFRRPFDGPPRGPGGGYPPRRPDGGGPGGYGGPRRPRPNY